MSIGLRPTTALNGTEIRVLPGQSMDSPKVWTMLVEGDLQAAIERISQDASAYVPPYSKDARLQIPEIQWIVLKTGWEEPIESVRPGDLVALDYDWNIEDLQMVKQISQRVHEGGGKFGIRFPLAEIHSSILDRPEWRLAPVPVFRWQAVPKSQDSTRRRGTKRGGSAAVHNSRSSPGSLLCFE